MELTKRVRQCWSDKWWLREEFVRAYQEKVSPPEVDRAICRVAEVFDPHWASSTPSHPVYGFVLAKGLLPLMFMYALGNDLLILEGSLRLPPVIHDLRQPSHFESARLELEIAAHLKRFGHNPEFRPPVPKGKKSDIVMRRADQHVYFEVKRLSESEIQRALWRLVQGVTLAMSDLARGSAGTVLKGRKYLVELHGGLANLFGGAPESDSAVIDSVIKRIKTEIETRLEHGAPLDFVIPSVANVFIGGEGEAGSSVNFPMPTSQGELKRILRKHFPDAIDQLHPEHPGIIVVQTAAFLESELTRMVLEELLDGLGSRASHVTAVFFFSIWQWPPGAWFPFKPFPVINRSAETPAQEVLAFKHLVELLRRVQ